MAYICFCEDHADSSETRQEHTAAHLAYIETILDQVLVAGPVPDEHTALYNGSCFVYAAESRQDALSLLHNDPYYKAGIYATVKCFKFKPAAGAWIGGKTW